jgi:CRISPR-associated protein Cas2
VPLHQHHLVIYDIADPKRLRHVARLMEDFGVRLQESVFDCWLTPPQLARLQTKMLALIHVGEDSVRYIPLCARDRRARQTQQPPDLPQTSARPPRAWVI